MEIALVLLPLALAHFAAVASPGPSFILIARTAAARSQNAALRMSLGMGLGATTWAAATLFGLALLFKIAPWTYVAMKVAGGLFLIWIAWKLWKHSDEPLDMSSITTRQQSTWADFWQGYLVQITNPKVSIFFGSVFVTLMPPDPSMALQALALLSIFAIDGGWYATLSVAFSTDRVRRRYVSMKTGIDRTCGTFLGLLGLKLAIT